MNRDLRSVFSTAAGWFVCLSVTFIPFPFYLITFQQSITQFLFGGLIGWLGGKLSGGPIDTAIHSDSLSMYLLVFILLSISIVIAIGLRFYRRWSEHRIPFVRFARSVALYYLALHLLKYGVDKVSGNQFYVPEPNTLYTRLGEIPKDLLYWSSMGLSKPYAIFLGAAEILATVLLLTRKCRLAGLLLSAGILLNIVAINFSFDISVKLFSSWLLFLCLYLLWPMRRRLFALFGRGAVAGLPVRPRSLTAHRFDWLVIAFILTETFAPLIVGTRNVHRPWGAMPTAFDVTEMQRDSIVLLRPTFPFVRFFIHKNDYFITEDPRGGMQDRRIQWRTGDSSFLLIDYDFTQTAVHYWYEPADSAVILKLRLGNSDYEIRGKAINLRQLPALERGFHWTSDLP